MKAVYYQGSGHFTVGRGEMRRPGAGEVRLDVAYCGLCGTDLHIARGAMDSRVQPPQVIGHEMSGTIAEVRRGRLRARLRPAGRRRMASPVTPATGGLFSRWRGHR